MDNTTEIAVQQNQEEQQAVQVTGTLDETCLSLLKNGKPTNRGKLNKQAIELVQGNVERGISMTTACLYAGIPPTTGQVWFQEGQEEVEQLTDEDIMNAPNGIESIVSLKGLFYLKCCRSRANCVVEIHNMLYDRAFESGKEWIATYLLERQEPEKYNLKYKVQQEVNANVSANIVEFKFIDGVTTRPADEQQFINEQVTQLKDKYSSHDIIDAEGRIIEEDENND